jgi:glycosyltransferase involved in cell wall biosynthesis
MIRMDTDKYKLWIQSDFKPRLVSVIIPTHNRVLLLKEAIQSIAQQTYRPIECIVIDDGSTEDVKSIVDSFSRNNSVDFEVKYLLQQNAGSQVARNNGTRASCGEYIQYLDSDDLLFPDKLAKQVAFLQDHPSYDAVFGDWVKGDPVNNEEVLAYAREDLIKQMLTERCVANFSILMTRRLVNKIGPWDEGLKRYQEIDYHLRGLVLGSSYGHQKMNTGLHRVHNSSRITTTTGALDILDFYKKWENELTVLNRFDQEMKKKIAALYLWFFYAEIKYNDTGIKLLKAVYNIDPANSIFQSGKFQKFKKLLGVDVSIRLFLAWMIFNNKKKSKLSKASVV